MKLLNDIHTTYGNLIKNRKSTSSKKLVTVWCDSSKKPNSGQYFESKILKNGNIKTRILTIYAGKSKSIGLETKVVKPNGSLVYKSAGLLKKTSSHFRKKIKNLELKKANNTISKAEQKMLDCMLLLKDMHAKIFESGINIRKSRETLYKDMPNAKTLAAGSYTTYE